MMTSMRVVSLFIRTIFLIAIALFVFILENISIMAKNHSMKLGDWFVMGKFLFSHKTYRNQLKGQRI